MWTGLNEFAERAIRSLKLKEARTTHVDFNQGGDQKVLVVGKNHYAVRYQTFTLALGYPFDSFPDDTGTFFEIKVLL